jgi:hypothetical protein
MAWQGKSKESNEEGNKTRQTIGEGKQRIETNKQIKKTETRGRVKNNE